MSSSNNKVVVLTANAAAASGRATMKLVEYLGAEPVHISLACADDLSAARDAALTSAAMIVHAGSLMQIRKMTGESDDALLSLLDSSPHVFVYGFSPDAAEDRFLQLLSSGGISGTSSPADQQSFQVSSHREYCGQFSGLSIPGLQVGRHGCFIEGAAQGAQSVLVCAGQQPFLVRLERGKSSVFLAACGEIADLDEKVSWKDGLVPWFSTLAPLMIFLKSALGERIWHSNSARACFILDDPPLKSRYGFLEYARLMKALEGQKFCASIAFIPWNYRRSRKDVVARFASSGRLSLCVHGCDHTAGEFASTDERLLRGKAKLALERMRCHGERWDVAFDDVMVFPQGLFSQQGLEAVESSGYLAAVNTDLGPAHAEQGLALRNLLEPAITTAHGFPLFSRHYPRNVEQFAFDLFVGKPALIVEHHTFFRQGYENIVNFVSSLNALDERLEWTNLAAICSRTCLQRTAAHGEIEVRFFTSRFHLENADRSSHRFVLSRKQATDRSTNAVTIGGRSHFACQQEGDTLTIHMTLDGRQKIDVTTLGANADSRSGVYWKPTLLYKAKVLGRRMMCDARDNYIETNRPLRRLFSALRRVMKPRKGETRMPVGLSTAPRQDAAA